MPYINVVLMLRSFPQDCPENPECLAFQECAICETFPNGLNCSNVNCTTEIVSGVDTASYVIDGSKCISNYYLYHENISFNCLAARTTFCRVSQGNCAYQYFVGTRGSSTNQDFVVEVMEAGK